MCFKIPVEDREEVDEMLAENDRDAQKKQNDYVERTAKKFNIDEDKVQDALDRRKFRGSVKQSKK